MAKAVAHAIDAEEHLLVQAGTGTGKSLAYLVPAVEHAQRVGKPAVVATATLALQGQIVDRDMPRLADALTPHLRRRPTYAIVKGRRNYVCKHKVEGGFPDDEDGLFDFYDRRVPEGIVSARHFDSWWKKASRTDPGRLDFTADDSAAAPHARQSDRQPSPQ